LQDLERNIFHIIVWTSLQLTDKEAKGQQSDMLNTKPMTLPFLSSERHKEIADRDLLIRRRKKVASLSTEVNFAGPHS